LVNRETADFGGYYDQSSMLSFQEFR